MAGFKIYDVIERLPFFQSRFLLENSFPPCVREPQTPSIEHMKPLSRRANSGSA